MEQRKSLIGYEAFIDIFMFNNKMVKTYKN